MIDTARDDATMLMMGTGDFRPAQKNTRPAVKAKNQNTRTSPIIPANISIAPEDTETTVSNPPSQNTVFITISAKKANTIVAIKNRDNSFLRRNFELSFLPEAAFDPIIWIAKMLRTFALRFHGGSNARQ